MTKIATPHDAFFKEVLTNKLIAKEFLQKHLPESISAVVDYNSLTICKESFIEPSLQMQMSDILYSIKFDNKLGYIYFLIEHQSKPEKYLSFRIIEYTLKIIKQHLKQNSKNDLPLVYPLVFYNGEKTPYPYSTDIMELFVDQNLARDIMFKPFQLIDINSVCDDELVKQSHIGLMQLLMKHIRERDALNLIEDYMGELKKFAKQGERDFLVSIMQYMVNAGEVSNQVKFIDIMTNTLAIPEEKIMTIAEHWRQEGRQEGRQEAAQRIARTLLEKGNSVSDVAETTKLKASEVNKLRGEIWNTVD